MSLPILTGTGRLCSDGEIRFSQSSTAVYSVNLAFSQRKKTQEGTWVDGDKLFIKAVAFGDLATNLSDSLSKGDEVLVTGRVKLNEWEDKTSGEKRSQVQLLVDSMGPTARWNTVTINKAQRENKPSEDTWSNPPASDQPPF
jgi:single-strand DNA-binding protein